MMTYRAVILDVDGTLVDSNDAHAHAWVAALAEHGITVEFARIRRLIGMGWRPAAARGERACCREWRG